MKIIADENIPFAADGFSVLGDVTLLAGRDITCDVLTDVGMLIVRSVTTVNADLLEGTPVSFVGTCTIGTDHVDVDYLNGRGIAFASAPGSNATSVADYIVAVMLQLSRRTGERLAGKSIAIIGVGNVGSRVEKRARALGMVPLLNDPPLERETGDDKYRPLDEVLADADIVTLHVPLTKGGSDATWHMANDEFLAKMKPGAWLFNSSRGAVHDTPAILAARKSDKLGALYLDVWENEPDIDVELLKAADVASPHVCGYSADGKVAGVVMIHRSACAHAGVESSWDPSGKLAPPKLAEATVDDCSEDVEDICRGLVLGTYDFEGDDAKLREIGGLDPDRRVEHFDALRKNYPVRREFQNTRITLTDECVDLAPVLEGLGFAVLRR